MPRARIGDGLRFLAGRKRVVCHLSAGSRGCARRWRGCGGSWLLRRTRRRREQAGRKKKEKCGEKCCGLLVSAIQLSSPDDAAPEKKPGRSARSMIQPAPLAQEQRRDVFCSTGILLVPVKEGPAISAVQKNSKSRRDAGAT